MGFGRQLFTKFKLPTIIFVSLSVSLTSLPDFNILTYIFSQEDIQALFKLVLGSLTSQPTFDTRGWINLRRLEPLTVGPVISRSPV
jgi:hypothetical protein